MKVGWLKAKDQTILALHHRVITHNNRFIVDHEDNRIWKLKIRSVHKSDAGCYMCQINTEVMKKQVGCIDVLSKCLGENHTHILSTRSFTHSKTSECSPILCDTSDIYQRYFMHM